MQNKLETLGWDPFYQGNHLIFLQNNLKKVSTKPIGQIFLNQSIFAGVGNYLRAEILYLCEISPWRLCKDLSLNEISLFITTPLKVLQEAYRAGGTTMLIIKMF